MDITFHNVKTLVEVLDDPEYQAQGFTRPARDCAYSPTIQVHTTQHEAEVSVNSYDTDTDEPWYVLEVSTGPYRNEGNVKLFLSHEQLAAIIREGQAALAPQGALGW